MASSDLESCYDNEIETLRTLTGSLYARLRKAHLKKEQMLDFEDSCETCKVMVRTSSEEIIRKIREHEQRLLGDLEAQRDIEFRKLGISKQSLIDEVSKMQNLYDESTNLLEHPKLSKSFEMRECIIQKIKHGAVKDVPWVDNNTCFNHYPSFVPIRCNTAFGSIDSLCSTVVLTRKRPNSNCANLHILSPTSRNKHWNRAPSVTYQSVSRSLSCASVKNESLAPKLTPMRHSMSIPRKISSESYTSSEADDSPEDLFLADRTDVMKQIQWQINREGTSPGDVSCATDVAFLSNLGVVVAEKGNDRLQFFSMDGQHYNVLSTGKVRPRRVAVTRQGNIAITDSKDSCIKVFSPEGHLINQWGKKRFKSLFKSPCGIAVNSHGQFIVSDSEKHTVAVYSSEGKFLNLVGAKGMGSVQFQSPSYIAVNHRDQIIVSDNWTHCIKVFDPAGRFLFDFNSFSEGQGHLKYPNGVCASASGDVIVADWGNHTVSKFSVGGMFLGHLLTRMDSLYHPAGVATDRDGNLAVTEYSDTHSTLRMYKLGL